MADAVDVQAAPGDIGGHQDFQLAALEGIQGAYALVLRHFPGQQAGFDAGVAQPLLQPAALVAAVGEHEGALHLRVVQQLAQQCELVAGLDDEHSLVDRVGGHSFGFDLDEHRA